MNLINLNHLSFDNSPGQADAQLEAIFMSMHSRGIIVFERFEQFVK